MGVATGCARLTGKSGVVMLHLTVVSHAAWPTPLAFTASGEALRVSTKPSSSRATASDTPTHGRR